MEEYDFIEPKLRAIEKLRTFHSFVCSRTLIEKNEEYAFIKSKRRGINIIVDFF